MRAEIINSRFERWIGFSVPNKLVDRCDASYLPIRREGDCNAFSMQPASSGGGSESEWSVRRRRRMRVVGQEVKRTKTSCSRLRPPACNDRAAVVQ